MLHHQKELLETKLRFVYYPTLVMNCWERFLETLPTKLIIFLNNNFSLSL